MLYLLDMMFWLDVFPSMSTKLVLECFTTVRPGISHCCSIISYFFFIIIKSIQDANERTRMEIQIMEFGQTPKQLFKTQHPQKFQQGIPRTHSLVEDSVEVTEEEDTQNLSDDVVKQTNSGMFTVSSLQWNLCNPTPEFSDIL